MQKDARRPDITPYYFVEKAQKEKETGGPVSLMRALS